MRQSWLPRLAITSAAVGIAALATATPAWADISIDINPGNVPTTAAGFEENDNCDPNLGGGPFPDQDVWVFNLPEHDRDFVSVTAEFSTDDDDATVEETLTIPDDGGAIVRVGTSKAWIATPSGWTLVDASATATGTAEEGVFFVLTHTCAGGGSTPTPSESPSPSDTPSESDSTPPNGTSSAPGGGGGEGGLPVTGTAVGGFVVLGVGLVAAGIALMSVRRRREIDLDF